MLDRLLLFTSLARPYDNVVNTTSQKSSFASATRETRVILIGFVVFCLWVVVASIWLGQSEASATNLIFGLPTWVFWGVAAPWLLANVFTVWFCFGYMKDEPLSGPEEHDCSAPGSNTETQRD